MRFFPTFIPVIFFASSLFAQNCLEKANVILPVISSETRKTYETKLAEAQADNEKSSTAETLIWLGRRTAYLGAYKEAIDIFTRGIRNFPNDARFYRHRGHRLLTIRCFAEAAKDFEKAAKLVKGRADETEPDGLPNARNIPTSTLQSNIFYHLGLAHYMQGNFAKALKAYRECLKVSRNDDMRVATIHWLYMTLRRMGKEKEAATTIADVGDHLDIIENDDYYKLLQLYQGKFRPEDLWKNDADSLSNISLAYGVGNWFLYNGKKDEARKIFRQISLGRQWSSFGFIAAEAELKR